jgi:phosphoribosyl-ATP pyrophosphohydrolase
MSPVLLSIDLAFRTIIDEACELFMAEAAQDTKEVIHELYSTLKSMSLVFRWPHLS